MSELQLQARVPGMCISEQEVEEHRQERAGVPAVISEGGRVPHFKMTPQHTQTHTNTGRQTHTFTHTHLYTDTHTELDTLVHLTLLR